MLRFADDAAVLTRDGDVEIRRDGQNPLHLPAAATWLDLLVQQMVKHPDHADLIASLPLEGKRLIETLIEHQVLISHPLCDHLARLHGATVTAREGLTGRQGSDTSFLLRELGNSPVVQLPQPDPGLSTLLGRRPSQRFFSREPLSVDIIGSLLGASVLPTAPEPNGVGPAALLAPRAYPSGGGLYPVELYLLPIRVDGLTPTVLRYTPHNHALTSAGQLLDLDDVISWFPDQPVGEMAALILLTMDLSRPSLYRYGGKAYRLGLLEAGHLAQNLILVGSALDVGCLPMCGFDDEAVAAAAELVYPYQVVLYTVGVGRPGRPNPNG